MRPHRLRAVVVFSLFVTAACATRTESVGGGSNVAPALVIEQFLRAANANDLDTMARVFGTSDGSIRERDTPKEVDDRMFALASILRHQDYSFEGEGIVPGRRDEAIRINVRLVLGPDRSVVVPFTLVMADGNQWMIEQIDIEKVTQLR